MYQVSDIDAALTCGVVVFSSLYGLFRVMFHDGNLCFFCSFLIFLSIILLLCSVVYVVVLVSCLL